MSLSNLAETVLCPNGYGARACRALLKDAYLLASAAEGYTEADLKRLFAFVPKEHERRWHDLELIDHTANVMEELHGALGGYSDQRSRQLAADNALRALLRRHRPRGVIKWWNIIKHSEALR